MIIVDDSERSNYVSPHFKTFFVLSIRLSRQLRQYDTIPRQDGNSAIGYFYYLSGWHGITTFVYSHICVRFVPSYQFNLNRGEFL